MHRVLYETGRPQLRGYAGLLALGAGVTFLYNDSHKTSLNKSTFSCQCAAELPLPVANPKEGHFLDSFKNWLESKHCETSGVDIRASVKTPTAGLGVFLAEEENKSRFQYTWWQWCKSWIISQPDIVLMRIPLENRISVDTICKDPKLGKLYRTLQENGAVTDRQIIMLFLIVERIRGSDSEWAPYFGLLPQAFNTPLFYGKAEMDELNGTTLHTATRVLKDSLKAQWSVIGPYAEQILRELGPLTQGMSATIDDLFWAHSVFWSRSLNWPAPIQKDSQLRSEGEGNKGTRPEEAIIPGIDFCNHSENPVCQWSVWNSALLEGGESKSVGLVCNRKTKLKPGDELTISYGDKSNEEFLMQYGFTLNKNPRDNLMIALDLGPKAEWNSAIEAKMQLLINKGLGPQIFLTQEELQAQSRSDCTLEQVGLKSETWEVLETLIMNDEDALAALEVLNRSGDKIDTEGCPEYTPLSSDFSSQDQMEGRRLALLTTITRILDAKVQELELGTGPLENDVKLIEAADSATLPQVYSCVVYRAGQKRLARGFQAKAKKALARQMVHMQALQSKKY